jgi:hypothetical protein
VLSAKATLPIRFVGDPIKSVPLLTIPNLVDIQFHDCGLLNGTATVTVRITNIASSNVFLAVGGQGGPPDELQPGQAQDYALFQLSHILQIYPDSTPADPSFATLFLTGLYHGAGPLFCAAYAQAITN